MIQVNSNEFDVLVNRNGECAIFLPVGLRPTQPAQSDTADDETARLSGHELVWKGLALTLPANALAAWTQRARAAVFHGTRTGRMQSSIVKVVSC